MPVSVETGCGAMIYIDEKRWSRLCIRAMCAQDQIEECKESENSERTSPNSTSISTVLIANKRMHLESLDGLSVKNESKD